MTHYLPSSSDGVPAALSDCGRDDTEVIATGDHFTEERELVTCAECIDAFEHVGARAWPSPRRFSSPAPPHRGEDD